MASEISVCGPIWLHFSQLERRQRGTAGLGGPGVEQSMCVLPGAAFSSPLLHLNTPTDGVACTCSRFSSAHCPTAVQLGPPAPLHHHPVLLSHLLSACCHLPDSANPCHCQFALSRTSVNLKLTNLSALFGQRSPRVLLSPASRTA